MCGPTGSEKNLQASQQNFASMLQSNYGTLFGQQQGVLNAINNSLSPVLAAGPSQNGFTGPQLSAMQTQIINNTSAATRNAAQAARNVAAGQGGGGTSGLTSGIQQQIQASILSQGAIAQGSQEANLAVQNAQLGQENYWRAAGGMQALASGYSPNAAMGGATTANQSAFGEANEIQQQQQQEDQMIAGGITAAAGLAIPGLGNLDTTGGSTVGEQFKNFFGGLGG
jgi:hypothetical protein